jgi:hypothetical protein
MQVHATGSRPCRAAAWRCKSEESNDRKWWFEGGEVAVVMAFEMQLFHLQWTVRRRCWSRKTDWRLSPQKRQPEATSQWMMRCAGDDAGGTREQTTGYRHLGDGLAMVAAPALRPRPRNQSSWRKRVVRLARAARAVGCCGFRSCRGDRE